MEERAPLRSSPSAISKALRRNEWGAFSESHSSSFYVRSSFHATDPLLPSRNRGSFNTLCPVHVEPVQEHEENRGRLLAADLECCRCRGRGRGVLRNVPGSLPRADRSERRGPRAGFRALLASFVRQPGSHSQWLPLPAAHPHGAPLAGELPSLRERVSRGHRRVVREALRDCSEVLEGHGGGIQDLHAADRRADRARLEG